jgi:hypothetical protein
VPLQISDSPASGTPGLTGHGLGGSAWGGHYDCPGAPILAQRGAIIARAEQLLGAVPAPSPPAPTTMEDDMPAFATGEVKPGADVVTTVSSRRRRTSARAGWGDVWFSLGSDFGEAHVRVAIFTNGQGWSHIYDDVLVPPRATG